MGPAPYLIRGHPERKQGQQRQLRIANCVLRIGASTMNREDLEKRTKEFALEIIRLLSNLPKTKTLNRRGHGGRRGKQETG